MMNIGVQCPFCGCITELEIPLEGYFAWKLDGELVQNAFPELTPTEREMLISGICPDCQKDIFGE